MKPYDIAIIGAGPAGCMAAICGAQMDKKVILLERNKKIGRKLLLTGNGRCNITNTAPLEVFIAKFGDNGSFYRDVFSTFSNHDLMKFFREYGLDFKEEENGRIFPITERSKSVVDILKKVLDKSPVEILYNYRVKHLHKHSRIFKLSSEDDQPINAYKVIIATGGASYKVTGSSGDGYNIVKTLGHEITELKPGGVPLVVREKWVPELTGVTLENVGLSISYGDKIMTLPRGNLLFTHFGISGPVILDMSHDIVELMDQYGDLKLIIDFKPEISEEILDNKLIKDFQNNRKKSLKNYLNFHLPYNSIEPILETFSLDPQKKLNQITKTERNMIKKLLKSLPITITGHLPLDKAMVTCGGVSKKQIDPRTMESKLIDGLYFAGEVIDGCGRRGGFNLQQAFSTGYVASKSAAEN